MTRQIIGTGAAANNNGGDTLRAAGNKINDNFSELYTLIQLNNGVLLDSGVAITLDDITNLFADGTFTDSDLAIRVTDNDSDIVSILAQLNTIQIDSDLSDRVTDNESDIVSILSQLNAIDSDAVNAETYTLTRDIFTGDGSTATFTLADSAYDPAMLNVVIDGLMQDVSSYSLSNGTSLIFSETPPLSSSIEVRGFLQELSAGETAHTLSHDTFTGDGSATTFTLAQSVTAASLLNVVVDGHIQDVNSYTVNGTSLIFSEAPPLSSSIDVRGFMTKAFSVVGSGSSETPYTLTRDTFTGTGAATTFILAEGVTDPSMLIVIIDGFMQDVSSYTVADTSLIFSEAPPFNSSIEVRGFITKEVSVNTNLMSSSFVADGIVSSFTLSTAAVKQNTFVYIDGVYQFKDTYSVADTLLTLSGIPPQGSGIEVLSIGAAYSTSQVVVPTELTSSELTGDGSTTSFTLSAPAVKNNTFVYINGVYQFKSTYSVVGDTLTFSEAPPLNVDIEVMVAGFTLSQISVIDDASVTTSKIADSNVTAAKIASNAVTTGKIASNAVTTGKIAGTAVTTAKIADANVTTVKIADDAITTDKVADGAITSAKLGAGVGGAYNDFVIKTTAYTAVTRDQIIVNSSSAVTITLPITPSSGNVVFIKNAGTGEVTVGRNGSNINSTADDGTLAADAGASLVYVDGTIGWKEL
jgi:hypothetical protein